MVTITVGLSWPEHFTLDVVPFVTLFHESLNCVTGHLDGKIL